LLDSSVGLGIIYLGIRVSQYLSRVKQWDAINFGEYGQYRCAGRAMVLSLLWCLMVYTDKKTYFLFQFGCVR